MSSAARCSSGHLSQVTSCLRRWIKAANEQSCSLANPSPAQLATFLRRVSFGGPSAASGVFSALAWCNKHLGGTFPLDSFVTRPFRCHAQGHKSRQAPELQPWELLNLVAVTSELSGAAQVTACFVLGSAVSCIRFRHFRRSVFLRVHQGPPMWLEFRCSMGKSRVKGSRPAYEWAMPDIRLSGFSLCETFLRYLEHSHPKDATFLWPALNLRASDLWQLADDLEFLNRRMSRNQFMQCFRGFLCRALVPTDEASKAGYNRLRRCMPTGAHHLGLGEAEAQAIGSWTELPGGSSQKQRAGQPMSRHYAGAKVQSSWQAKQQVVDAVLAAFKSGSWPRAEGTSLLKPGCLLWPQLGQLTASSSAMSSSAKPEPALADEGDSSSDSSSCGEISSGESCVADEEAEPEWFLQGSKRHVIRELDPAGRLIPWCRESAFVQDPVARGIGVAQTAADAWCSRCLGRTPGPQAKQLRQQLE